MCCGPAGGLASQWEWVLPLVPAQLHPPLAPQEPVTFQPVGMKGKHIPSSAISTTSWRPDVTGCVSLAGLFAQSQPTNSVSKSHRHAGPLTPLRTPTLSLPCKHLLVFLVFPTSDDDIVFEDFARQRLKGMKDDKEEEEDGTGSPQLNDR